MSEPLFNNVYYATLSKRDKTQGFSVNVTKFTRTPTLKNICKELIFGFKIEKPSEFQLSGSNNSFYTPYHGYTLFTTIKLAPPFLTSQMSIKVIIKPKCPCVLLKILL